MEANLIECLKKVDIFGDQDKMVECASVQQRLILFLILLFNSC